MLDLASKILTLFQNHHQMAVIKRWEMYFAGNSTENMIKQWQQQKNISIAQFC